MIQRRVLEELQNLCKEYAKHHAGSAMDRIESKIEIVRKHFNVNDIEFAEIYYEAVNK